MRSAIRLLRFAALLPHRPGMTMPSKITIAQQQDQQRQWHCHGKPPNAA
jgi:hypothetical protein